MPRELIEAVIAQQLRIQPLRFAAVRTNPVAFRRGVSHVLSSAENAAKLACTGASDLLSFAEFTVKPDLPGSRVSVQTRHKLTLPV
jgi:hypothetical protein